MKVILQSDNGNSIELFHGSGGLTFKQHRKDCASQEIVVQKHQFEFLMTAIRVAKAWK